ncbi:MAG: hypothetical protein QOH25_1686 [Acidobacteriota bacterium]|jgi:hypothetical protein|nr:hypothetical protein [Acidobacteriota bacterium]
MNPKIRVSVAAFISLLLLSVSLIHPQRTLAWGEHGHKLSGRAAATRLPKAMPGFFRKEVDQLEYLNPEPDRWRSKTMLEMNEAFSYDHFLDLEMVPAAALEAEDRYAYLVALYQAGVKEPEKAGILPFRILELFERLRTEFHLWRNAHDNKTRKWVEQRILNDGGVLGHYVSDGANPHHATIHYNGWDKNTPNPNGYTTDNKFHGRFESEYVQSHIVIGDLLPLINAQPRLIENPRAEILAYLRNSNSLVERLYQLDKQAKFDAQTTAPENKRFAVDRLVAGVEMLRALWWTAWMKSETLN